MPYTLDYRRFPKYIKSHGIHENSPQPMKFDNCTVRNRRTGEYIFLELVPNQHEGSDPFLYQNFKQPLPNISEEKSLVPELRSKVRQRSKVKFPVETGFS